MDCCTVNGLPVMFGGSPPRKEADAYRKKGLPKRSRSFVGYLKSRGVEDAAVLDIGFGVGSAHLELLKLGARKVVGFEIVEPYIRQAEDLATESGFRDAIEYRHADFTRAYSDIEPADIVILDRSVCCYPDMPALVGPSAELASRFYGVILPVENIVSRAFVRVVNALLGIVRREFRVFIHPQIEIDAIVDRAGLDRVLYERSGVWRTILYERRAAAK